jgi:RNA polymerase sigma-70 factor, ECF subfamily
MEPIESHRNADPAVHAYLDDIYRFLRQLTGHQQDAEDLTQQTLLRALRGVGRFKGDSTVRTWLHRIAYREYLNWSRGRRIWLALDPRRHSIAPDAEAIVSREVIRASVDRLSPKLRAAFLLVEVQELGLSEAATVLGIPEGTVKSRLYEARVQLRQILGDTFEELSNA